MARNGNRPGEGAAHSVGELSKNATEFTTASSTTTIAARTCALAEHPTPIRAELGGDRWCSALGITATSNAPVLALCRRLIEAGHDPSARLEAYRGTTLSLRVRSIGEGAKLTVHEATRGRPRFTLTDDLARLDAHEKRGVGPPVAQKPSGVVRYPPGDKSRPRPALATPVAPNDLAAVSLAGPLQKHPARERDAPAEASEAAHG
jgi:hypothetical protein